MSTYAQTLRSVSRRTGGGGDVACELNGLSAVFAMECGINRTAPCAVMGLKTTVSG